MAVKQDLFALGGALFTLIRLYIVLMDVVPEEAGRPADECEAKNGGS